MRTIDAARDARKDGKRIDAIALCELRAMALGLFLAGKRQRAIDIWLGLAELGWVHPGDARLLARALRDEGDGELAAAFDAEARALEIAMQSGAEPRTSRDPGCSPPGTERPAPEVVPGRGQTRCR